MDEEELRRLLDLDGSERAKPAVKVGKAAPGGPAPAGEPVSDTCLVLDKWGRRRGAEVAMDQPDLAHGFREAGVDISTAMSDFYALAFEGEPQLEDGCLDGLRMTYIQQLVNTPEYRSLHTATMYNVAESEIAAARLAEGYLKLRESRKERERKEAEGKPGKKARPKTPLQKAMEEEMEVMKAVGEAIRDADEEVDAIGEIEKAVDMESGGMGPGAHGKPLDPKELLRTYRKVRNDPVLKSICEKAGRFRRLAQAKQRKKFIHGYDDMIGVRLDDRVDLLLPEEAALLCEDGEIGDDAARRLIERETLAFEYVSVEQVAKGPIVIVVDESGSMKGAKVQSAKALALAMAYVARQQKRWCALISYSGGKPGVVLPLPPGKWNQEAIFGWLGHFYSGGSMLDLPIRELPSIYWPGLIKAGAVPGKTDVIFITDAVLMIPPGLKASFMDWKAREKVKVYSLVLGYAAGDLEGISDETHLLEDMEITASGDAVESVLSV